MELVDSSKKQLKLYEIVQGALERDGYGDHSKEELAAALMAIAQEMNMPDAVIRQFGNSLAIIHVKDGNAMFRILNMDTAQNFLQNAVDFFSYMTGDLGVEKAVTSYKGTSLRGFVNAAFRLGEKQNPDNKFKHEIISSPQGDDVVVIYAKD